MVKKINQEISNVLLSISEELDSEISIEIPIKHTIEVGMNLGDEDRIKVIRNDRNEIVTIKILPVEKMDL